MASKPRLPEELVSLIFKNFDSETDSATIHALRLSNKLLCRLATPFLRRTIKIGMPTPGNSMKGDCAEKDTTVIQQLIEDPEWTSIVKELIIGQSHASSSGTLWTAKLEDEEVESTAEQAANLGRTSHDRAAYILSKCKNIEIFQSKLAYSILGNQVTQLVKQAASDHLQIRLNPDQAIQPPNLLNSLKKVYISDGAYENALRDALDILCFPALQHLRIDGLADTSQFFERNPPPHDFIIRNSNPITLVLDMCMLSGRGLDTLLATCPNAKALTIRWRAGGWNEPFQNPEACDVLRERGRNLEMLHYDTVWLYGHRYRETGVGTMGSFGALNAKRLALPKAFFDHLLDDSVPVEQRPHRAAELLPEGSKELYILGVEDKEMADVMTAVGVDVLPNLEKSVCVPWEHSDLEEWFGTVSHRNVDYDRLGGFELKTIK